MGYRLEPKEAAGYAVGTHHIVEMLEEALQMAKVCHGQGQVVDTPSSNGGLKGLPTIDVLERAADRLTHAAAELREERQSLLGWRQ